MTISLLIAENWRLQALVRPSLLHSPANEAVDWEVQEWHAGDGLHEPYVGEPRPELEDAWRGLLGSMSMFFLLVLLNEWFGVWYVQR